MALTEISKEEILAVYPKVAETMADALGCDVEDVKLDVSLIEGLDAESIDFLDMPARPTASKANSSVIPRGRSRAWPSSRSRPARRCCPPQGGASPTASTSCGSKNRCH